VELDLYEMLYEMFSILLDLYEMFSILLDLYEMFSILMDLYEMFSILNWILVDIKLHIYRRQHISKNTSQRRLKEKGDRQNVCAFLLADFKLMHKRHNSMYKG